MNSKIGIALGACVVLALLCLAPTNTPATELVNDNFDSYTAGTYPGAPWWNMFSGIGASVTTEVAMSAPNSLRLESSSNWARWDCITLTLPAGELVAAAQLYFTDATRGGAVGFGFVQPGQSNTGWLANAVMFGNDGQVYWATKTAGSYAMSSWTEGHWWGVEIAINYASMQVMINLSMDNQAKTTYGPYPVDPPVLPDTYYGVEVPLNNFGIFANNFSGTGSSVFFADDVLVNGEDLLAVEETTWGALKARYK